MLELEIELFFQRGLTMETRKLIVSGIVQGVGFRWSTQALANKMNLPGTVKNNPDGTVTIYLQGESSDIDHFIEKLTKNRSQVWKKCTALMYYISYVFFK